MIHSNTRKSYRQHQ